MTPTTESDAEDLARLRDELAEKDRIIQRYRQFFEGSRDGFVMVDTDGRITDANQAFCDLLGYTLDELRAMESFYAVTPKRWHEWEREEIWNRRLLARGFSGIYEKEYVRKDGSTVPVELQSYATFGEDGSLRYLWGVVRNITARKRSEEALHRGEQQLRMIAENSAEVLWQADAQGVVTYASPASERVWGYRPDEAIGRSFREFVAEPALPAAERAFIGALSGVPMQMVDVHGRRKDGSTVPLEISVVPIFSGKRVGGIMGVARDVTERKQAEAALRESERQKNLILNSTSELVAYLDRDLRIVWANRPACQFADRPTSELVGRACYEAWHGRTEPCVDCAALEALKTKAPHQRELTTPDGRHWILRGHPVLDDAGEVVGLVEFGQDITRQAELEQRLRQSRKLEAIGRLAGGIAHDFNNLLTVINGHAEILRDAEGLGEQDRADVEDVIAAGHRAADLTRQLLAFSRRQPLELTPIALNDLIERTANMLHRLIGEDVALQLRLAPDAGVVRADAAQIEQVLLNLAVNARDAMPHGGTLTLATANVRIEPPSPLLEDGAAEGDYVRLSVADTGVGMDATTREQIFEPFFTTKEVGRGTGLGLATVYGIIKQHEGSITVESEPGQGTTLHVLLPGVEKSERPSRPGTGDDRPRGTETVLLVEDEHPVRVVAQRVLERAGYRVWTAEAAEEAIRMFEESGSEIDILVTDVVMPEADGNALYRQLAESRPELPVLFVSGYPGHHLDAYGVEHDRFNFLEKPFSAQALVCRVREVLDRAT
jgi:PAS domain S-box-containing protein